MAISWREYFAHPEDFLECQDCGDPLRHLTPGERAAVADNPHNYIAFCNTCGRDRAKEEAKEAYGL